LFVKTETLERLGAPQSCGGWVAFLLDLRVEASDGFFVKTNSQENGCRVQIRALFDRLIDFQLFFLGEDAKLSP
jgi:hypothetical protein